MVFTRRKVGQGLVAGVLCVFVATALICSAPRSARFVWVVADTRRSASQDLVKGLIARLKVLRAETGMSHSLEIRLYPLEKRELWREIQVFVGARPDSSAVVVGVARNEGVGELNLRVTESGEVDTVCRTVINYVVRQGGQSRTSRVPAPVTTSEGFREYTNAKDQTVLIKIPGGTFQMGSNESEDEQPPHSVTLAPYLIGRVPVTNAQFARFVSATGHDAGSDWRDFAAKWGEQAPVVCVSWNDANAYCTWAGLRLPTEEEWEYAARGPQSRVYPWGNQWDPSRCQNSVGSNSPGRAASVGRFPSGASPFGCLDMAGNVWQWTSSWYDRYPGNTTFNTGFGKVRVLRGGAWNFTNPTVFRGAYRLRITPVLRIHNCGWRCARTI